MRILVILTLIGWSSIPCNGQSKFIKERERLKGIYGVAPARWLGWADGSNEVLIRQVFRNAAKASKRFSAEELYTLAIGEGLNNYIDLNYSTDKSTVDVTARVDGFHYLGLDHFGTDVPRLKAGGFLRKDFSVGNNFTDPTTDCVVVDRTNEQHQAVKSAEFRNLKTSIEAFAAVLAHRQSLAEKHSPEPKRLSNKDERFFWTYAYFIDGEGDGKKHIQNAAGQYAKSTRSQIKEKCMRRLATLHYVHKFIDFTK